MKLRCFWAWRISSGFFLVLVIIFGVVSTTEKDFEERASTHGGGPVAYTHGEYPLASTHEEDLLASTHGEDPLASTHGGDPLASTGERQHINELTNGMMRMKLLFVMGLEWTECRDVRATLRILNLFANSVGVFSYIQIASISTMLRIDEVSLRADRERDEVCWTHEQKMKIRDITRSAFGHRHDKGRRAKTEMQKKRSVTYPISHVGPQYHRAISDEDAVNLKHFGAVIFTSELVRSLYAEWDYGNFETIREPPKTTWAFLSSFYPESASRERVEGLTVQLTPERNELESVLPLENVFRPKLSHHFRKELTRVQSEILEMWRNRLGIDDSVKSIITITLSPAACATEVIYIILSKKELYLSIHIYIYIHCIFHNSAYSSFSDSLLLVKQWSKE